MQNQTNGDSTNNLSLKRLMTCHAEWNKYTNYLTLNRSILDLKWRPEITLSYRNKLPVTATEFPTHHGLTQWLLPTSWRYANEKEDTDRLLTHPDSISGWLRGPKSQNCASFSLLSPDLVVAFMLARSSVLGSWRTVVRLMTFIYSVEVVALSADHFLPNTAAASSDNM